jgi:hypothetical protein
VRLSEIIDRRLRERAFRSEGLDSALDLTPLSKGEFLSYTRRSSLLVAAIAVRMATRTPEEAVEAMINAVIKGYCKTCYEYCRECKCSKELRQWI